MDNPKASPPSGPSEVVPRVLPPWARRAPALALTALLVGVVGLAVAIAEFFGKGRFGMAWFVVPAGGIALGARLLWRRRRAKELLRTGLPITGRVDGAQVAQALLHITYSFESPHGLVRGLHVHDIGEVVKDFGLWPAPGDLAFVVVDRVATNRNVLWGVAQPAGQVQRTPPTLHRPLSLGVVSAVIAGALAVAAAGIAWAITQE